MPALSVIIPYHKDLSTIALQLEALESQDSMVDFEVLVCDNGPDDGFQEWCAERRFPRFDLRYVEARDRRGAAFARNRGIGEARAEKLAFCDADDVVGPHWVRAALESLDRVPVVNGSAVAVPDSLFNDGLDPVRALLGAQEPEPALYPAARGAVGPALMAGCFAARREFLRHLGGFDASLVRGGEDNDLGFRIAAAGLPLMESAGMSLAYRKYPATRKDYKKAFYSGLSLGLVCAHHDLWSEALPYTTHPAFQLGKSLMAAAAMVVGARRRDVHGVLGRIATASGLMTGWARYKKVRRVPAPMIGAGISR